MRECMSAQSKILLIAGQQKAGTTSLYHWLSLHPMIQAGKFKETRFFVEEGSALRRRKVWSGENLADFEALFGPPADKFLLDASPDYYSSPVAVSLPNQLRQVSAIVIVRDPLERLQSSYEFFRQRGEIAPAVDFSEWIKLQNQLAVSMETPAQMRALDQCLPGHLEAWKASYGRRLLVLDFDSLRHEPQEVLFRVASWLDIDPDPFRASAVRSHNRTMNSRAPRLMRVYVRLHRFFSDATAHLPGSRGALSFVGRLIRSFLNSKVDANKPQADAEASDIIKRWSSSPK